MFAGRGATGKKRKRSPKRTSVGIHGSTKRLAERGKQRENLSLAVFRDHGGLVDRNSVYYSFRKLWWKVPVSP